MVSFSHNVVELDNEEKWLFYPLHIHATLKKKRKKSMAGLQGHVGSGKEKNY